MIKPKNILVTTTSSIEGMKIVKHLQPISAHIVLGTNIFSDFFGGLSDVFGGKSGSYQKRLNSIYNDAIDQIKNSCYQIGGNCVLGLKIDIDEISGKGKSMFMITAIGTAVYVETETKEKKTIKRIDEKISAEEINILRNKNLILQKANDGTLNLNDKVWNFITENQMEEIFPFLINKLSTIENYHLDSATEFTEKFKVYIDHLPDDKKREYLYNAILNGKNKGTEQISQLLKEFQLLDYDRTIELIEHTNLEKKKIGLKIATYDKPYYDFEDIECFSKLKQSIESSFGKRGEMTTKKQMLSSKDKEVWECECGKTNSIKNEYCIYCLKDIYGFKEGEINKEKTISYLENKIHLIKDLIK